MLAVSLKAAAASTSCRLLLQVARWCDAPDLLLRVLAACGVSNKRSFAARPRSATHPPRRRYGGVGGPTHGSRRRRNGCGPSTRCAAAEPVIGSPTRCAPGRLQPLPKIEPDGPRLAGQASWSGLSSYPARPKGGLHLLGDVQRLQSLIDVVPSLSMPCFTALTHHSLMKVWCKVPSRPVSWVKSWPSS